jgi:hypothetical protein
MLLERRRLAAVAVETHGVETHGVETHGVETHGGAAVCGTPADELRPPVMAGPTAAGRRRSKVRMQAQTITVLYPTQTTRIGSELHALDV